MSREKDFLDGLMQANVRIRVLEARNEKLESFVRAVKQADESLNCYGDFSKAVVAAIETLETK